jgi:hypothetical protein
VGDYSDRKYGPDVRGKVSRMSLRGVEITAFAYATENEGRVERAIRNLIPEGTLNVRLRTQTLNGHFKDPITLITASIKRREAKGMFRSVISRLNTLDQQRLLDEVGDRVDDSGNLYIRVNKQIAYHGSIALEEVDPIRIKFRLRRPHGSNAVDYARSVLTEIIGGD